MEHGVVGHLTHPIPEKATIYILIPPFPINCIPCKVLRIIQGQVGFYFTPNYPSSFGIRLAHEKWKVHYFLG